MQPRPYAEELIARREEKTAMMKAHYRKRGWGRYVPPPEPAWMRGDVLARLGAELTVEETPPWRRGGGVVQVKSSRDS